MKKLVILESPGKIKKVSAFLKEADKKNSYIVKASIGHVRELANSNDYNMGIDTKTMTPEFVVSKDKTKVVKELIAVAKTVDEVIIATDPDREGEAIAWHLYEILKKHNKAFTRMRLNSITKECVEKELTNLGSIDTNYVMSALSRQMLDKIVGYRLSPTLQKTTGGVSAGRVQSAVLRILANRQKEIEKFNKAEYFIIQDNVCNELVFKNFYMNENKIPLLKKYFDVQEANQTLANLKETYNVSNIVATQFEENKFMPFSTGDLLKAAKSKLKFKALKTTKWAQRLYEKGLITYIRTDSNNLDKETEQKLKEFVVSYYGPSKLGKLAKTKSKTSDQEGHPAITPTHFEWLPENIEQYSKEELEVDEIALYKLIWQNTINSIYIKPSGIKKDIYLENNKNIFFTTIKSYLEKGYFEIDETLTMAVDPVFEYKIGDKININKPEIIKEFEKPPSKLNEISLIEQLQKLEIGRPSTFKSSVEVNVSRNYVEIESNKAESMFVNELGMKVNDFLEENFSEIISLEFTKNMEKDLDLIAKGELKDHIQYLKNFYSLVDKICKNLDGVGDNNCEKCGRGYLIWRNTKKGNKFKGCSNYPECDYVEWEKPDYSNNENCEKCNEGYLVEKNYNDKKTNKTKKFLGCSNYPQCTNAKFK